MIRIQDLGAKRFLRELVASVNDDNVFNGAAALGFFLTMAIFPGLIVLMSVIPYLPIPDIDSTIMDLLRQALPSEAAVLLQDVVTEVTQQQRGGALSFGLLATLWIASSGMYAIMQQLNITYGVKEARSLVVSQFELSLRTAVIRMNPSLRWRIFARTWDCSSAITLNKGRKHATVQMINRKIDLAIGQIV
ncbi:MAG: YhjD/YihY/BrkB family envelope integrity protein [Pseudomonadota bacterium]|nr:YhjD/YihY/BrkB family envelope integrity protein [Pseudomonadota bacterium]